LTQSYILRRFEPSQAEYEAIVRVYDAANPDEPGSADAWRHWDQHRDPARMFGRFVVEQGGEIGGYGWAMRRDPAANKFRFAIYFLPDWETVELIHDFYSYLRDHCLDSGAAGLLCQTRENESAKIDWLQGQGYQEAMRYPRSILTVADFAPGAYTALKAEIAAQGIEIISLVELATREPDWQRKVYDLEMTLARDVPMPTAFAPPPFEKWVGSEFEDPNFMPELWLIALDGDAYVGMASLYKLGAGIDILETGLTGVDRQYRRRGLATALKCQVIEVAQRLGARRILTSNEENNPMFQLNLRLGFEAQPAEVDWECAIT